MPTSLMPETALRLIDVYPYRRVQEHLEFLLLRRATDVRYSGQWRMVGGKIERGEAAWQAALRELREETGCAPVRFWSVPSVNTFYEWQTDRVNLIPAFAAQLSAEPTLNHEHDTYAWLSADEATRRLRWPEQQRLLKLVARRLHKGVLPELEIPLQDG